MYIYICFGRVWPFSLCVFYSSLAYSVSVSQGFLRFATLCGVFPLGIS